MALKDELVRESQQKSANVTSETLETEQKIGAAGREKDELVRESHQKSA